jgi:hypothetical protein
MVTAVPTNNRPVLQSFIDAVRALPAAHAEASLLTAIDVSHGRGHDAQLIVRIANKSYDVIVDELGKVYPRDVRNVLWQFRQYRHGQSVSAGGGTVIPFVVADLISPGAKELLREEHIGYYDSGGSLFFPAAGAYLYIDKPSPKNFANATRSLYSDRRAQVLHALLVHPETWFGVKDLAEEARVSAATASQVLTDLERFDWLSERGLGPRKERMLREPSGLLNAWAQHLVSSRPPPSRRYFVPRVKTAELMELLGKTFPANDVEYAISYEAAAQLYAPFLSDVSVVRCRVLRGAGLEAAIRKVGARSVSKGANLEILEVKSGGDLLFREKVNKVWLASPIQVYLDLLRVEGRAKEMAEHLRREKIKF